MPMKYRHGHGRQGHQTPTYNSWHLMKQRCRNKNRHNWFRYGGRGIDYCERWESFQNFLHDMGERPHGMTLERKDNSMGYCEENCVWATPKHQQANTRTNRILFVDGHESIHMAALGRFLGMNPSSIQKHLRKHQGKARIRGYNVLDPKVVEWTGPEPLRYLL